MARPRGPTRKTRKRMLRRNRGNKPSRYRRMGALVNQLTTKRFQNLALVSNLTVDNVRLTKANNYVKFTSPGGSVSQIIGAGSIYASLANLTDVDDYGHLFDRYKIVGLLVTITPLQTDASTEGARVAGYGQGSCILHYIRDFDDAELPLATEANINIFRQYPNYKSVNIYAGSGKPVRIFIRPKVSKTVYAGLTNSYETAPFPWIDMNNQNAQGYGIKFLMETIDHGSEVNQYFKFEACYYLKFRNPR